MNHLKAWRLERGFSQHALTHISQVPRHEIQLAEAGLRVPSKERQAALAKALGVPAKKLFPETRFDRNEKRELGLRKRLARA